MPILSHVVRRHPGQIALRVLIYVLLSLGALGIIYPVLIVVGQTLSDQFDLRDNAIVPDYLRDRSVLALKYVFSFSTKLDLLASRHNRDEWLSQVQMQNDRDFYPSRPEVFAEQGLSFDAWQAVVGDLDELKGTMDSDRLMAKEFRIEDYYRPFIRTKYNRKADELLADLDSGGSVPRWLRRIYPEERERKKVLADPARLGLAIMNHELRSDYLNYYSVEVMRPGNFIVPFWQPGRAPKERLWSELKASLPPEQKLIISSDSYWHAYLKLKHRKIETLNATWGTEHRGFYGLHLSLTPPHDPAELRDWQELIVKRWPRRLLKVPDGYAPQWRGYVRGKLVAKTGSSDSALTEVSRLSGKTVRQWDDLDLPGTRPEDETLGRYWCEFTSSGAVPAEAMILDAPELSFRSFLRRKYGKDRDQAEALAALNRVWAAAFKSFDDVPLPLAFNDYAPVRFTPGKVRRLFVTESYRRVSEYMLGRGRAVQNTLILVCLSLLSALTINPIAAYSLSRFPMKHTQKILIFFLATMAFPAEVAMIPSFLLLRDLGLLNTYAALVLPRMANGFAIFLLKGFFDSLPQELYEAAEMDGATEIQTFRLVAMPLVKPILAYIGLNTFVLAYSSFMWAFVICPKQEMWTLMVWIYDFQMKNPGNNYIMAATVLVSIPPLLVFLFANRIIMKGIVIPSLK